MNRRFHIWGAIKHFSKLIPLKIQTHWKELEPRVYIKNAAQARITRLYPIGRSCAEVPKFKCLMYVMKQIRNILFLNNLFRKKYSISNVIRIFISWNICCFVSYIWMKDIFGKGTKAFFLRL